MTRSKPPAKPTKKPRTETVTLSGSYRERIHLIRDEDGLLFNVTLQDDVAESEVTLSLEGVHTLMQLLREETHWLERHNKNEEAEA